MNTSKTDLQNLKQMVIKQKTSHLEPPDNQPHLAQLHEILYQYEEHISKLVFQVFQGSGEFTPYEKLDLLAEKFKRAEEYTDSESQRLLNQYRLYKERLDEIYKLVQAILNPVQNGENSHGG